MKELKEIIIKTRRYLLLNSKGEYQSHFLGEGLDFRELREYSGSDDIRHLNWKALAKTSKAMVNNFNESRQLSTLLIYLNSGGLIVGKPKSKKEVAIELLTSLSYASLKDGNLVGSLFFDNRAIAYYPPKRQKGIVDINYNLAKGLNPLGSYIDYEALSNYLLKHLRKKSILYLIGDFMEFANLSNLAKFFELNVLIVRDDLDENLPTGEYQIIDTKSLNKKFINIDKKSAKRYKEALMAQDSKMFNLFKRDGIRWKKIYTNEDIIKSLILFTKEP